MRKPDFENNLLRVLRGEKPQRATMFELFLNDALYEELAGHGWDGKTALSRQRMVIDAMAAGGYDYAPIVIPGFIFPKPPLVKAETRSLNREPSIVDWESFGNYAWPDPDAADYGILDELRRWLPEGMKFCVESPEGFLENVINLVGYDNLCYMLFDDYELVRAIFEQAGSRLLRYYERVAEHDTVGFLCCNDDWGFNTHTFLSTAHMRELVFPWHKKFVEAAHRAGKPCMLHSCGNFRKIIDDIVDDIGFDARHSYEDNIMPVEEAYELLNGRIAVLGGMDMNLMTVGTPEEIYNRSRAMLERAAERGGYALGSGNSIAPYITKENFFAMTKAALDLDEMR